jgi:hypothetical protein
LQFLHITKTGGSAIEKAGAAAGIMWGACYFLELPNLGCTSPKSVIKTWNQINLTVPFKIGSLWHIPISYFQEDQRRHLYGENVDFFSVVRNPYRRVLSEFYCPWEGYKSASSPTVATFNKWIHSRILDSQKLARDHFHPQHRYIWDDQGRQVVRHVLRQERLQEDFASLMKMYGIVDVVFINQTVNAAATSSHHQRRFTIDDFDNKTAALINLFYEQDFQRLGYEMKVDSLGDNHTYTTS